MRDFNLYVDDLQDVDECDMLLAYLCKLVCHV
jgi:hypothetical protein